MQKNLIISSERRFSHDIMTSNTWNSMILTLLFFFHLLFTVLVITTHANGDDRSIDTRDGEDINLHCRFNKEYSNKNFIYFWSRSSQKFENVAFDGKSLSSNYMWVQDTRKPSMIICAVYSSYRNEPFSWNLRKKKSTSHDTAKPISSNNSITFMSIMVNDVIILMTSTTTFNSIKLWWLFWCFAAAALVGYDGSTKNQNQN